ncbi:MAG: hypothetical protein LQ339_006367 [Xanthoria mediterranea]|nr:MAG: hypothetical protein LQ339_006367 [Xanthoria mediterranea]
MEFLNNAFYDGPQYLSGHLEDALYNRSPGSLCFNRAHRWPCSGGICPGGLPDPFCNESGHGRSQYNALYASWPQHPHKTFDRAQSLDEIYLQPTEGDTESYRTAFRYSKPTQDYGYQERRRYRPSSYISSPRCPACKEQHDPSFPFDVHFGFGHCGEKDSNRTTRGYTVVDPNGSELPTSPQLPHGPRSKSPQGSYGDKFSRLLGLGAIAAAATEDKPRVQSVSTSGSSSHESRHAAAPPPSPHPGLVNGEGVDSAGVQEESPSSTPSRHPSSPCSPHHERMHAPDEMQAATCREEDLGAIYHHIFRQYARLKRKTDKLHRLRLKLFRREEKLRIWELELLARDSREGRTERESGGYNGLPD